MPSYGAVDTEQPSKAAQAASDAAASNLESNTLRPVHSYKELDMRFLEETQTSKKERRRKMVSTVVPILIAFVIIGLFAKLALGAIGPYHDPKYSSEFGSNRPPAVETKTTTTSTESSNTKSSYKTTEAPAAAPVASTTIASNKKSDEEDTKSKSSLASCSKNDACNLLGLIGECCPTAEGVMLGCCN